MTMKLTIVPSDGFISIDGRGFSHLDMSSVPENIHAVQWDGAAGWIEYSITEDGAKPANTPINSITDFQAVVDLWTAAAAAADPVIVQTKTQRLTALAQECNEDIQVMQLSWLAAEISDGESAEETKAGILQEIADRKAQYKAERLSIINEV
jgi:hypothetical protein